MGVREGRFLYFCVSILQRYLQVRVQGPRFAGKMLLGVVPGEEWGGRWGRRSPPAELRALLRPRALRGR